MFLLRSLLNSGVAYDMFDSTSAEHISPVLIFGKQFDSIEREREPLESHHLNLASQWNGICAWICLCICARNVNANNNSQKWSLERATEEKDSNIGETNEMWLFCLVFYNK